MLDDFSKEWFSEESEGEDKTLLQNLESLVSDNLKEEIKERVVERSSEMISDQYGQKIKNAAIVAGSALVLILLLLVYDVYLNIKD